MVRPWYEMAIQTHRSPKHRPQNPQKTKTEQPTIPKNNPTKNTETHTTKKTTTNTHKNKTNKKNSNLRTGKLLSEEWSKVKDVSVEEEDH